MFRVGTRGNRARAERSAGGGALWESRGGGPGRGPGLPAPTPSSFLGLNLELALGGFFSDLGISLYPPLLPQSASRGRGPGGPARTPSSFWGPILDLDLGPPPLLACLAGAQVEIIEICQKALKTKLKSTFWVQK